MTVKIEVGTLAELNLKPREVVECVENEGFDWWTVGKRYRVTEGGMIADNDGSEYRCAEDPQSAIKFRVVYRTLDASNITSPVPADEWHDARGYSADTPKSWGEWESAKGWEKDNDWLMRIDAGCLEVMDSDGNKKVITHFTDLPRKDIVAYRIKSQPQRETVTCWWGAWGFTLGNQSCRDTHRITFTTTDGKPDLDSIKMEEV